MRKSFNYLYRNRMRKPTCSSTSSVLSDSNALSQPSGSQPFYVSGRLHFKTVPRTAIY